LPASSKKQKLIITDVHDWATIFINGKSIGKLDRRRGDNTVEIPVLNKDAQLDILIEATGRVNYGKAILDRKGITEKVELVDGETKKELKSWQVYNFPVDHAFQKNVKYTASKTEGPAWYKASFTITKPGDTFLDVSTWGKGMVWVNGHNLGRYWKIGPQQTMYLPGVWLKKGENEIIFLDVDKPSAKTIRGVSTPILDKINPDESLLHRAKAQKLNLMGEKPVHSGSFTSGSGWKEENFSQPIKGRYICIEALNGQQPNSPFASLAELELIGADGKILSPLKWKILYASSEEVTAGNYGADKIYDQQESTFWQSQSIGGKPSYPHQIVLDLGAVETIKGIRSLPRSDKKAEGMIKDYRVFIKTTNFKF